MKPVKVSALMTLMMVDEVATVHASADLRSGDVAAEVERWLLRCHDHPRAADVRLWLDRYDAQQQPEANKLALITPQEGRKVRKHVRDAHRGLLKLGVSPDSADRLIEASIRKRFLHRPE